MRSGKSRNSPRYGRCSTRPERESRATGFFSCRDFKMLRTGKEESSQSGAYGGGRKGNPAPQFPLKRLDCLPLQPARSRQGAFPPHQPDSLFLSNDPVSALKSNVFLMAFELHRSGPRGPMDTLVIGGTLLGTLVGAFVIQKVALQGLLRALKAEKRGRR